MFINITPVDTVIFRPPLKLCGLIQLVLREMFCRLPLFRVLPVVRRAPLDVCAHLFNLLKLCRHLLLATLV
jgi:hypothetical protein